MSKEKSKFDKIIEKLELFFNNIYVEKTTDKIVELEGNNIIIKTLTLISMIALIIVYFFYILSYILHSFGTDIWFNSTIIIFIIFVIFLILFSFLSFIIGFAINKNKNVTGDDIKEYSKKYFIKFFKTVSHLLMNILFLIPVILSLSLMLSILKIHLDIKLLNIPKDIINYILIFLPVVILVLLIIDVYFNKDHNNEAIIFSLLSGILNISTILSLSFVFSFIIEKLMKMWYKNEKDYKLEEGECDGEPNPNTSSATPTIMNNNTALYKNKIGIYFATEDSNNPNNKFWLIGIIIYIALVIATFLMHYILLYQPVTLISNIKLKGKVHINSVINNFFYSEQQKGGSKRKLKRK